METETQGKRRRARITVSERLAEVDAQIAACETRLGVLRLKRTNIVAEARERAAALLAEVGPA